MTKPLDPALAQKIEQILDRHVDDRVMHAVMHRLAVALEPHLK
jgi:hypothetical protein